MYPIQCVANAVIQHFTGKKIRLRATHLHEILYDLQRYDDELFLDPVTITTGIPVYRSLQHQLAAMQCDKIVTKYLSVAGRFPLMPEGTDRERVEKIIVKHTC